jgi:hypothetical protein
MAEGDGAIYNNFKEQVLNGEFDLTDDTIKVGLVTGHSPDIDTHTQWSDVSGDEESGAGYSAGGETLGSKAVTQDNDNDRGKFDAADVTWSGLDVGTPSHAIMYDDTHASDLLIAYWELSTASNGGDYTLQWHANGIILLT